MSRTFTFEDGNRVTCATAEEAYNLGYEVGATTEDPRPGVGLYPGGYALEHGPTDAARVAYVEALAENNIQWLRGFDDGRAAV